MGLVTITFTEKSKQKFVINFAFLSSF